MLTTASTPGQGGGHPNAGGTKVQGFPTGYLPVPTSATPGAGQTLVFGQLGVLGSPQPPPSLQQQQQQQSANKQDQVQKVNIMKTYSIILERVIYIYSLEILLLYYVYLYNLYYVVNSIQLALPEHLLAEEVVECSLHLGNLHPKYGLPAYNNQLFSLPRPIKYSFAVRPNRICLYRVHNLYKRTMVSIFVS